MIIISTHTYRKCYFEFISVFSDGNKMTLIKENPYRVKLSLQDASDGCLGVLVHVVLSCFVC